MTYVPTAQDIEWTRQAIVGKKVWAVPSASCVFLLDHEAKSFNTYMIMNISALELSLHDRIGINLLMLGFAGENRFIVEGANHVDDILKIVFHMKERGIRESEKYSSENKPYDPRFD
jgi:hypothetical protein